MTKIVTFCQRGNVRSVTTAIILKDYAMYDDVLVAGVETTSETTRAMLYRWADIILICGDVSLLPYFDDVTNKIHLDIGVDEWQQPMNPSLVRIILHALKRDTSLIKTTRWDEPTYLMLNDQAYLSRRGNHV